MTFEGVTQVFGEGRDERVAVEEVDLDIAPGELVCLVGPSGCGKSSLLNLVAGFAEPAVGRVLVDGVEVDGPGADRGMVFQHHRLFPWMSVRRNVEFGPRRAGVSKARSREIAEDQLALVGLADVADRPPYELSGGMQQRAAIARALAGRPRVLLMDEPFSALDALTRERLQDELIAIWRATGVTVVFVTHSVDEAVYLASRLLVLSAHPGRILVDRTVPFSSSARPTRSRTEPEFASTRDELSAVLRQTAA